MDILQKEKNTPKCDWVCCCSGIGGAGKFVGLYSGEHIVATDTKTN